MTVISLAQSNIVRSRCSIYRRELRNCKKSTKYIAGFLIFLIIAFMFIYCLEVNSLATTGYKIRNFKKELGDLENINKDLQIEISNLKSIDALQLAIYNLNMVKASNIEYVDLDTATAMIAQ